MAADKDNGNKGDKKMPAAVRSRSNRSEELMSELRPRIREARNSMQMMRRNPSVMLGFVLVGFIIIVAALAPVLAPPEPNQDPFRIPKDYIIPPKAPGVEGHIFGTGDMGIDIYYGVVWGAQTSIYTSLMVIVISTIMGLMLGAVAGFYGGKVDEVIMRITDIFLSLPALILAMAISSILEKNLNNIIFALALVWWPAYARYVRAQVLTVREATYVEAARAIGSKKGRILFRHILPNSITPLMVAITMDIGAVALTAAGLSYIGFGVGTGYAEWGRMVSDGQRWFVLGAWWCVVFPGLFILLFTMGFSLIGDGLRDILDPRAKR